MMMRLKPTLIGLACSCVAQTVLAAQSLEASSLYREVAQGCRTLDLKSWSHPTRKALQHAHVQINKVELCKQDVYPIFTVRFDASPMLGVNDKYFNKLYVDMAVANAFHPFALVDPAWGVIVGVDITGKREISVSYDEFDALEVK